ncbi:efflux RND transporter periplasmic adaptor subunit [Bacillus sp. UMB0728]|uniref:efflux RND transporter periplasmic adaptor subunit n=1 Tax=Bacillus sp. UMB0728 TaxID=2066052 RepID=UPI000C7874A1|nr:RND transporter [Bacillus sp. UMB0728]PLR73671.1 RND transporter [Bacillus sp. UMB0728]
MGRRTKRLLALLCVLAISVNMYLLLKDGSKADRAAYISKTNQSSKKDIIQKVDVPGVVSPAESTPYYFDKSLGTFGDFLVKEQETVTAGTPLFEYTADDVWAEVEKLEAEKEKTEQQAESIGDHISELIAYKATVQFSGEDEENTSADIIHNIEKDIYDKKLQQELFMEEASMYERQIQSISSRDSKVTVLSKNDGIVQDINYELGDPAVVISSSAPNVTGVIEEADRHKIEEGMKVSVSVPDMDNIEGMLVQAGSLPEEKISVEKNSEYPYAAALNESEGLFMGKHVSVSIITEEIKNAITVPETAIFKEGSQHYVWAVMENGLLEKRKVVKGKKMEGAVQITEGLVNRELVVFRAKDVEKNEGPMFITPAHPGEITKNSLKQLGKSEALRYFLKGLTSN